MLLMVIDQNSLTMVKKKAVVFTEASKEKGNTVFFLTLAKLVTNPVFNYSLAIQSKVT